MNTSNQIQRTPSIVGYWLLLGCVLVAAMVIIGGITRLTHSGLSMTTWKPITGIVPPMNEVDWNLEFESYQTSPEFKKVNHTFSLEEFKSIFWWEFIHRFLGRIIGMVFFFPYLYFLIRGKIKEKSLHKNLIIIFILGGLQGLIGWYMVYSGLIDIPAVSHYRLATHLCTALLLFCYLLWIALGILDKRGRTDLPTFRIKKPLIFLLVILSLQIIYGGFVAGLKAGLVFPTFPKMGNSWIAESIFTSLHTNGLISLFEDLPAVQFIHRWLGALVVLFVIWIFIKSIRLSISGIQKKSLYVTLVLVFTQFILGVFTLINLVPVSLGVIHQFFALVLLTSVIVSLYLFKNDYDISTL